MNRLLARGRSEGEEFDRAYDIAYRGRKSQQGEKKMATLTASKARTRLYRLIDDASSTHEPVVITGKRSNAVLVSEDDWNAIQETVYLLSVPGMRESIRKGLKAPIKSCSKEPGW
jgi:prevent-host-death family protein